MFEQSAIPQLADLLQRSRMTVALTGAGISVESGIPAFRGSQGLWDRYDPLEYAHIDAFMADPGKVWKMLAELGGMVDQARPNPAHLALAQLEAWGQLKAVITQNIDALHQRAGNREVIEFHGNGQRLRCLHCGKVFAKEAISLSVLPPRCPCKGILKPEVVFFGEPIPVPASQRAFELARTCEVMLVIGTSALVAPASHLPLTAKQNGAVLIEINLERTHLSDTISDFVLEAPASQAFSALVEHLRP
ncbi:MAG TPA: NAD-dependent deacylase [Thermodesulfobacteriota bacterium]|nr:NAD-dependent deacylase [Thermodesulfobacteriota bacterium]